MDYEHYERMKEMFLGTWPVLIPRMGNFNYTKSYGTYTIESLRPFDNEGSNIIRIYGNGRTGIENILFEMSYNSIKYFSTFTNNSIRIAYWKPDHPRYYALYDPDNAIKDSYTFIEFPCETDYFFQRSILQETLDYEDYELWDTEVMLMQETLVDHPSFSIGLVLNDYYLTPNEVNEMCLLFFNDYEKREENNVK